MAEIESTGGMTASEIARREHNGRAQVIVDIFSESNPLLLDAQWEECNNGRFHTVGRVAVEVEGQERRYNQGVPNKSATTAPYTERTCMIDGESVIDSAQLRHSADGDNVRQQESDIFMRKMTKRMSQRTFYGDQALDGLQITGLSNRSDYNVLSTPSLESGYVYDNAGGNASVTVNKMSTWFMGWGNKQVKMVYPRHDAPSMESDSFVGINAIDKGEQRIVDTNGNGYYAKCIWFEMHFGIFIYDPRYVRRIPNISNTGIDGIDDFGFDEDQWIYAYCHMPSWDGLTIYIPRNLWAQIWIRAKDKGNVNFTMDTDPFGRPMQRFLGAPIRVLDQLSTIEATVTT